MRRVGPRMRDVVFYVARHPGCAILPAAQFVGPHASVQYGYRTVHRAIAAGLVTATRNARPGRYELRVTEGTP